MSGAPLWAALVLEAIVVGFAGVLLGARLHREQARMRGEAAIRVLDAIARNSPSRRLPRVPTLRVVAKSHGLPDPYPPHVDTETRPYA